jgi:hypothetical protein
MIVVRGFPKSGKTTVIRRAFDELRREARVIARGTGYKEVRGGILEIDGVTVASTAPATWPTPWRKN